MLGLHLGLSSSVVDTIERDYHTTPERKKRMVQRWMSTPQFCPSWCTLVKALDEVGLNTAAEMISKEYSKCHGCEVSFVSRPGNEVSVK